MQFFVSSLTSFKEGVALGLTISKSIWLRCEYTLAILDGVENIVDDHQTFP